MRDMSGKKLLFGSAAIAALIFAASVAPTSAEQPLPQPARGLTTDLKMKIVEPFTVASVGDIIMMRPATVYKEPAMQAMWKIIRDADIGVGNFEGQIRDEFNYSGPLRGFSGAKAVAEDLKKMGITLVGKANNHTLDSGEEGLFHQINLLQDAGIVVAGAGRDLDYARAPQFQEVSKGRVGLVQVYTVDQGSGNNAGATRREGQLGGRGGPNVLRTTKITTVTAEQFAALKNVRTALLTHRSDYDYPAALPTADSPVLNMFGALFTVGPKPSLNTFIMNKADHDDIMMNIKNGKEYAHVMFVNAHVHQVGSELEERINNVVVPDFEVTFAHDAIDNGADAFFGTGPHLVRGIEIYKGKPIFYGLGQFFHELNWQLLAPSDRPGLTLAEANEKFWDGYGGSLGGPGTGIKHILNSEAIIAVTKYDKGLLQEVRIYPTEGRNELSQADSGLPRLAGPAQAKSILERLQRLSAPYGTKIDIDGSVGVIRVAGGVK